MNTTLKTCFKCGREKERSEFYTHKRMGDRLLGKCKQCTRKDVAARISVKKNDLCWVLAERERCREKTKRARSLGAIKQPSKEQKREISKRYRDKYPEKYRAHNMCQRLPKKPCEVCGSIDSQRHHHDYTKPLSVRYFCAKHHAEHHSVIRGLEAAEAMILSQPAEGIAYAPPIPRLA